MAFTFDAFCNIVIVALVLLAWLLFFAIFHIIEFHELDNDYKTPTELCASLNPLVLPEYFVHMLFTVLFGSLLWNFPLVVYHVRRYMRRPVMSCAGLYDATSIMNDDELSRAQTAGWAKLGFYLITFFYYLYSTIYVLVS